MDYWWALGHSAGCKVKVCGICGKIVDKDLLDFEYVEAIRIVCSKCKEGTNVNENL